MRKDFRSTGIVVLYNASPDLIKGEARDLLAEQGVIACAQAVSEALSARGYRVAQVPLYGDVETTLAPYPSSQWTVFNLAEGLAGKLFEEARIAWALEAMGYSFTGGGGTALAHGAHKAKTKDLLLAHQVPTPAWWLFRHADEVEGRIDELAFPLIVKPVAEDASIGVGPEAVVHTEAALRERIAYVVDAYRQTALAEAFVVGREFNVSIWGDPPQVLPLAEIDFCAFPDPYERIVSFAAKWEEESFEYRNTPVLCPAPLEPEVETRITVTALRAWHALSCQGYARVDMRLSKDGVPYVVEVNCNPDLSPDAGFYRAASTAGYSYGEMAEQIVEIAWRQYHVQDRAGVAQPWPIHLGDHGPDWRLQPYGAGLRPRTLERIPG
jgi:D-alanine-D-alanine ligase